jgi:threonine dehydrogenase-like Zn-dependent dehydrogenase
MRAYEPQKTLPARLPASKSRPLIAVHGVKRAAVQLNDSALVVGAGNIGLLAVQVLKTFGCSPVIAADVDAGRLEWAGGRLRLGR